VAGGLVVLIQGSTGTFIVTTATKQSLPPVAEEEFMALRLKEYVGVAPVLLPVEIVWLASFEFEAMVSVTTVMVFSTQSPKIGAQDVITYTEAAVRVMTLVEEDLVGGREETVVEVTVAGDSAVLYEEEYNGDVGSTGDSTVEFA
jgi:hypothetical protein